MTSPTITVAFKNLGDIAACEARACAESYGAAAAGGISVDGLLYSSEELAVEADRLVRDGWPKSLVRQEIEYAISKAGV